MAKDTKKGWQMIQNRGWQMYGWQIYAHRYIYVYLFTEDNIANEIGELKNNMAREIGELKNNMARFCLSNFYFPCWDHNETG